MAGPTEGRTGLNARSTEGGRWRGQRYPLHLVLTPRGYYPVDVGAGKVGLFKEFGS